MAARSRYARRANNGVNRRTNSQMYVYGSAVRQPAYAPDESPQPLRPVAPRKKKKTSKAVKAARKRNRMFIGILCACAVFICLSCGLYVSLQTVVTKRSKLVAQKQEELSELKETNDAKYNEVMDSVNLDDVRKKAIDDLGMVYANNDQVVTYDSVDSDYVEQYEDIPEDGVLASDEGK